MNWGSYDTGYSKTISSVTVKEANGWRKDNAELISAVQSSVGPVSTYNVVLHEGVCPPLATAIDASKITFDKAGVTATYAQLIPGTPTVEESKYGPTYKNCGTINIYVNAIPEDATQIKVTLKEALTVNWGSYDTG